MNTVTLNNGMAINVPELADYALYDKSRATRAAGSMKAIWEYVINPVHYPDMMAAVHRGEPPVSVVADGISALSFPAEMTFDDIKQFTGAVTAYWLLVNGLQKKVRGKTEQKGPVHRTGWNVGQLMTIR